MRRRMLELWEADRGRAAHYLVAGALAVFTVVEISTLESPTLDPAPPAMIAAALVTAVALLLVRRAPFAAPLVAAGGLVATVEIEPTVIENATSPFIVAVLFAPWCLATYNEPRRAVVGLAAMEVLVAWVNYRFQGTAADYFWVAAFAAVAWATGFVLNRRSVHARELAERARLLEQEQETLAARAVTEERQRIARELHDVIAHSVSVMTVQAGAVRRLLRPEQEKERRALEQVEATGRQALTEMRRLVGLLREQGAMPEFAPQPGMATVDTLLERVREAGLPVELEVEGDPRELPPGVDLAAYRVLQEALTNALRYAGPAHAWVTVRWAEDELELEVANDGAGDGRAAGGGHGLAGMRERVALYGGEIEAGAREGGGYVVRARLPLGEAGA